MSLLIESLVYPPTVLPGGILEIDTEVQFLEQHSVYFTDWYVSITDVETGGKPFQTKVQPWGPIGSWDNAFSSLRPGFYMPDRPWNLRVEVGIWDFFGQRPREVSEVRYITIYNDTPPIACDEGFYWDPSLGVCVEIKDRFRFDATTLAMVGMGLLVVGSVIFGKTKKKG